MVKTGELKNLTAELVEKQKSKGTFDSPCMSICNYEGLFKQCQTCNMRKAEKSLWKTEDNSMKETILRAISGRQN
jgi:predicted Fe-S protein YdhL (DUF1289 family)